MSLFPSPLPQEANTEKLSAFISTLNGKDGTGSHLVTVPPGPSLADALLSSPILAGEGGAMLGLGASDFEFGVDPSADPELALVSPLDSEPPSKPRLFALLLLGPCPTVIHHLVSSGSPCINGGAAAEARGRGEKGRGSICCRGRDSIHWRGWYVSGAGNSPFQPSQWSLADFLDRTAQVSQRAAVVSHSLSHWASVL